MHAVKILLWIMLAAVLVAAAAVYVSRASRNHLNLTPDAGREIEKAKRR